MPQSGAHLGIFALHSLSGQVTWSLTAGLEQDDGAHARVSQPASAHGSAQSKLVPKRLASPIVL